MQRSITVEITLSGLCLVWVRRPDSTPDHYRGPETATEIEVFLAKTENGQPGHCPSHHCPPHKPMLTYYAADRLEMPDPQTPLQTSPAGLEVVEVPLADKHVIIHPPFPYDRNQKQSTLKWALGKPEVPATTKGMEEDGCLDWILNTDDLGLGDLDLDGATTRVSLPEGDLRAKYVFRNRKVRHMRPVRWAIFGGNGEPIRDENGKPVARALACDMVFTLKGLWDGPMIELRDLNKEEAAEEAGEEPERIYLIPDEKDLLQFSISNLPNQYHGEGSHLPAFSKLFQGNPTIYPPEKKDVVATMGSECEKLIKLGGGIGPELSAKSFRSALKTRPGSSQYEPYLERIGAPEAWAAGICGAWDLGVAIVDSGIDTREGTARDSLNDRVFKGWNSISSDPWDIFDEYGHGTEMAAIVGGSHATSNPIRGVACHVRMLNFKVVGPDGRSAQGALAKALEKMVGQREKEHIRVALFALDSIWRETDSIREGLLT